MCVFYGIESVTQTRGLMSPEMPLDSWDRLQLPLQMGTGLPQILCHPTQPEQTPEVAKDISNGRRQPCIDNWVSPHPSSHKSHAALSQSVSEGVPRPWGALLSRHLMKSGSYHLRKKTPTLRRHGWISCILSLVPNLFPFFFLTSVEKWAQILPWPDSLRSTYILIAKLKSTKNFSFSLDFSIYFLFRLSIPPHISGLWPYSFIL